MSEKNEVLSLHRKLAAETLRADTGWQRYKEANEKHQESLKQIELMSVVKHYYIDTSDYNIIHNI